MKEDNLTPEQIRSIQKAFDHAINNGPWQESNFLRTMGKRLEKIRDDFLLEIGQNPSSSDVAAKHAATQLAHRSGKKEIYIALYSSNGAQLSAWEKLIANLPRQLVSRPIYAEEKDIVDLIKSKSIPQNEAYICALIHEDDIKSVPEDKIPRDRLDHPLITVKDRAISLDDISRFVHISGTYQYLEGHLVKTMNSATPSDRNLE